MTRHVDPWLQTILLLTSGPGYSEIDGTSLEKHSASFSPTLAPNASRSPYVIVSLLERTTPSTVTLAWRDPTSCFYGEQTWRVALARVSGICALSGKQITRGDRIYHPRRSKPEPVNARAMILESVLNSITPLQEIPI
jgi:hypothetical protein